MILYKYFPCNEYTYQSLVLRGLWCHTYEYMNDPFECLAILDREFKIKDLNIFRKIVSTSNERRWKIVGSSEDDKLTNLLNDLRKKLISKYAFCSLSENPRDVLMWSHYANSHKGIVVGFEFPELDANYHLIKVDYNDELRELDLEKYAHYLINGNDNYLFDLFNDYSIKSTAWSDEKEWRIWRNKPCYYHFRPEQVKEVFFGLNTTLATKAIIYDLMSYSNDSIFHELEIKQNPLRLEVKK